MVSTLILYILGNIVAVLVEGCSSGDPFSKELMNPTISTKLSRPQEDAYSLRLDH